MQPLDSTTPTRPNSRLLLVSVALLLLLNVIAWPFIFVGYTSDAASAFISFGTLGPAGLLIFVSAVVAVAWIPPIAAPLDRFLNQLHAATAPRPILCSIVAGLVMTAYLVLTALSQHRPLFPCMHDEFSYLIQAHQLAGGHLWMPPHPLAPFFDSFQLLVQPVYASAYFPGTALLHVLGVCLHLPPYVTSLAISGVVAALLFWITTDLLGGIAGWLAVLLLASNGVYRQLSIMTLAQLPLLLYSLMAITAWLRWRKTGTARSAAFFGIFLGLAAITRPVDALCFAIPIGVAVLFHRRRYAIFSVIVCTIPALCLQLVLNHGVTGRWLQTPFSLYADRDYPGTTYGFHPFDPDARPVSKLQQKQMLYEKYRPAIQDHQPANVLSNLLQKRLRKTLAQQSVVPYPLLVLLGPLSLLVLTRRQVALLATLPLFLILYAPYAFFMPHYVMVAAPGIILAMLSGANVISNVSTKHKRLARIALTLFIAGEAISGLPQWSGGNDNVFAVPLLKSVNRQLATLPHWPAVVLFKFDPDRNLDEEPVYNADVAWPDDAPVIRAHDRERHNDEIFRYYAAHQPERFFYRFDEATGKLTPLGTAAELNSAAR